MPKTRDEEVSGITPERHMEDYVVRGASGEFSFAVAPNDVAAGVVLAEPNSAGYWELSRAKAVQLAAALLLAAGVTHEFHVHATATVEVDR
jgi:hypothetical protein